MRSITEQLAQYATYHRDRRNIATHFVGIPMIVLAVCILLSRPSFAAHGGVLSPATVVAVLVAVFYLALDVRFGVAMCVALALCLLAARWFAMQTTVMWIVSGVGLFVVGWVFQFVGHHHEGRKPAFLDDLMGLLIGPLFVVAEIAFALGWRKEISTAVEAQAGPTHIHRAQG
jgi:uncharacterized membrane protein YGL010W